MSHTSCRRPGFWACAAALTLGGWCANLQAQAQPPAPPDLAQFVAWTSGEWNNNEQVWQQKIDAADPKELRKEDPVDHLHQLMQPVVAPQLGAHVLYLQQSRGDDLPQLSCQPLLKLTLDAASSGWWCSMPTARPARTGCNWPS